eukprot:4710044-Pyramimonas_sp.AAC.1
MCEVWVVWATTVSDLTIRFGNPYFNSRSESCAFDGKIIRVVAGAQLLEIRSNRRPSGCIL